VENKPLSIKLKGQRRLWTSCDDTPTRAKMDVSGPSRSVEDARGQLKNLENMSEQVQGWSEQRKEENSPRSQMLRG